MMGTYPDTLSSNNWQVHPPFHLAYMNPKLSVAYWGSCGAQLHRSLLCFSRQQLKYPKLGQPSLTLMYRQAPAHHTTTVENGRIECLLSNHHNYRGILVTCSAPELDTCLGRASGAYSPRLIFFVLFSPQQTLLVAGALVFVWETAILATISGLAMHRPQLETLNGWWVCVARRVVLPICVCLVTTSIRNHN